MALDSRSLTGLSVVHIAHIQVCKTDAQNSTSGKCAARLFRGFEGNGEQRRTTQGAVF